MAELASDSSGDDELSIDRGEALEVPNTDGADSDLEVPDVEAIGSIIDKDNQDQRRGGSRSRKKSTAKRRRARFEVTRERHDMLPDGPTTHQAIGDWYGHVKAKLAEFGLKKGFDRSLK